MRKHFHKRKSLGAAHRKKAGSSPGMLVHVGERKADHAKISLIHFSETQFEEKELTSLEDGLTYHDKPGITWINIDGLHVVEHFEKLGESLGIHALVLEDILNTRQRPKLDDYEDYLFVVMKMASCIDKDAAIEWEQLSLIVGSNYVISFQEKEGDVFQMVRDRLRSGRTRIRKSGADYLAYALIDAVVDHYFYVLDRINEEIDVLDARVIHQPTPALLQEIYYRKREVVDIRKSIVPLRDVLSRLQKGDPTLISEATEVFFGDVFDHLLQVIESVDANREILSGLIDLYLSSVSNRMNEIMKVLTIMAAIFIPITFVAGIYGMNFEVIPELKWKYGYAYVWTLIVLITGGMLVYFKKKDWI